MGGKGPQDPEALRFSVKMGGDDGPFGDDPDEADAAETTVGSLGLKVGDIFGYWFDFGDNWWHQIGVLAIKDQVAPGKVYPRLSKRVGQSPPQYPSMRGM